MNRRIKPMITVIAVAMIIVCFTFGFSACNLDGLESRNLNFLADAFAYSMLGNDVFSWNVFSVDPENSFGYVQDGNSEWYSYSSSTQQDMTDAYAAFDFFKTNLNKINVKKLRGNDISTYNTMKYTLDTYLSFYGSANALKFTLMRGDYLTSEGGYVANFTTSVENFEFRNKSDFDIMLSIINSTEEAFKTYLDYAADRVAADMPLFDYTLNEMQGYLAEILEQGESYYLYRYLNNRIDNSAFLSDPQKSSYKAQYKQAIDSKFFSGIRALHDGLDAYKGHVTETENSYLAAYGQAGAEYYQWCFERKTGLKNVNLVNEFSALSEAYDAAQTGMDEILEQVNAAAESNPTLYNDFHAYLNGDKKLLGITDPNEMIVYLKQASKKIVPDLEREPEIDFKYMDETVGKRTNTMAYYLLSPLDSENAAEHITLNPYYIESNKDNLLLLTIAHEGYPGHLYAHVNAKEIGSSIITCITHVDAFSEGWAVYTELALLDVIADETEDAALRLFCDYYKNVIIAGYIGPVLTDISLNYFGTTVADCIEIGMDKATAQELIEGMMEIPSVYVSYGYGVFAMVDFHNQAQALGDKYNVVEFNRLLLSEGMGPTLERAQELTNNYIYSRA